MELNRSGLTGQRTTFDSDESELVTALRLGDEAAFGALIDRHYAVMLGVASLHVSSREAAEDVVQDTFLAIIRSIDRFEERSSLRTWMFHILVNRAKSAGQREHRTQPLSSAGLPREYTSRRTARNHLSIDSVGPLSACRARRPARHGDRR